MDTTNKNYEFTGETMEYKGRMLHRIRSTKKDPNGFFQSGELGGWIESPHNLRDEAWVGGNAKVYGESVVMDRAYVGGDSQIHKRSIIRDDTFISGHVEVIESEVNGDSDVGGHSSIISSYVGGFSRVSGHAQIRHSSVSNVTIYDNACIERIVLLGDYEICGDAFVTNSKNLIYGTIYTNFDYKYFFYTTKSGQFTGNVGCWRGTPEELLTMAQSDKWVDSRPENIAESREELVALANLLLARERRLDLGKNV